MQGLKDIKDVVEINSNSLYFWIILLVILGLVILFYLVRIRLNQTHKKRKSLSLKKIAYQELLEIDFIDTKKSVYKFTQNFRYFLDENNIHKFNELNKKLEIYKYKKEIPALNKDLVKEMKNMIGGINANF